MKSKKRVLGVLDFSERNIYTPPIGLLFGNRKGCGCFSLIGLGLSDVRFDRIIRFVLKIISFGLLRLSPIRIQVKIKIIDHCQCRRAHGDGKRFSFDGVQRTLLS